MIQDLEKAIPSTGFVHSLQQLCRSLCVGSKERQVKYWQRGERHVRILRLVTPKGSTRDRDMR